MNLTEISDNTGQQARLVGMWVSLLTAIAAVGALGIAITTAPARSGPNCPPLVEMGVLESCVTYPYTDVAAYVPTEYIWMIPAMVLSLLFVGLVTCIFYGDKTRNRIAGHLAILFAAMSATVHCINYFIQLSVIQPSLLKGETESLSLLSQYNPHGIFIALEDLGYLLMAIVFLLVSFAFSRHGMLERVIKTIFQASSIVVIGGLIVMALVYRSDLEYRYEVLSLMIDWLVLIVTGILLFFYFRRSSHA